MSTETLLLALLFVTIYTLLFFTVGYTLGRLNLLYKNLTNSPENANTKGWFGSKETRKPKKVVIDETKFVTDIKTGSFEKDFESLGEETVSDDGISASVSKLSQLKKK